MAEKSVSFRTHLQSNAGDLLSSAHVNCLHTVRLVTALISHLAAYTEEGRRLAPSVFICNSVAHLVGMAGAGEAIALSQPLSMESAATKILKVAAPLCTANWKIYIERHADGQSCTFGVFCGSNDPSSLSVDEVLLSELDPQFPIVRISQSVTNKVKLKTSAGASIEFRFNDDVDITELKTSELIYRLAAAAANGINNESKRFTGFMSRLLSTAIRESHGTLIAVTAPGLESIPEVLSDAVILNPPLDLYTRYQLHFEEAKTAVSVSRLQTASDLLTGFVSSDGITILTPDGKVLGYRSFIKSADPETPSAGGARTRAFAALSGLVGTQLNAAFFRSQDGRMALKSVEEE